MFFVPGTTLVYDVKLPTPKEIHQKRKDTKKKPKKLKTEASNEKTTK